jgi:hypothetical protein
VPIEVCEALVWRLAGLGAQTRMLLEVAAQVGRTFALSAVMERSSLTRPALVAAHEEAVRHGLIGRAGNPDRFAFRAEVVREAIIRTAAGVAWTSADDPVLALAT